MYTHMRKYFLTFTVMFWSYTVFAAEPNTRTETEIRTESSDAETRPDTMMDATTAPTTPEATTEIPPTTTETNRRSTMVRTVTETDPVPPSGFYLEPGITYENLDTNISWPAPYSGSSGTVRGAGLMARLGFHANQTIFLAFDGRYVKPTFDDSATNVYTDSSLYDYGPVLGAQVPYRGMRVWGQYIMGGTLDTDERNGLDYRFDNSQGYRVGLGMHIRAISLNLEYQDLTYDTNIQGSSTAFAPNVSFSNADLVTRGLILSLTFPLSI